MSHTILIVEDEAPIRLLLRQTLEDLEDQARVIEAHNGHDGVLLARKERPSLILLDVMMPGMNGYEVCEVLRGDEALKDTKIVLVTARGQDFDKAHGEMVGADRHVTKPFDPSELLELVEELLGEQ